jgi:hypothetical protein
LDDLRISALAAVAILIGVQVCAWPVRASTADVHAASAGTTLVTFGQVFDTLVASASDTAGRVGFVWGDNRNFGSAPGVEFGQYSPAYRSTATHDTEWFYRHHPDWIVYRNDRLTVAYEFADKRATPFDIGNPAVVSWKQAEIDAAAHSQAWVDLDNIDSENSAGFAGHYASAVAPCEAQSRPACRGAWRQDFTGKPNDPTWIGVNLAYVKAMRIYTKARGRLLMINDSANSNVAYISPRDQIALAKAADGSMSEGFPVDGCAGDTGWIDGKPHDGQFDAEYSEFIAESARPYFAIAYLCNRSLERITHDQAAWITAAFLLGIRKPAINYLAVVGAGKGLTDYQTIEPYPPSLNPKIGPITARPPAIGSRPYVRRFAHGLVALNPSSMASATITVPAGTDQFGEPIRAGARTLQPLTGLVVVTP